MQTIIKNARIIDGSGKRPPFLGSIVIIAERIAAIYEKPSPAIIPVDAIIIDAQNNYVSPGFIDIHSHSDLVLLQRGGIKPKIMQGVTTEVIGQCGFAVAPMPRAKQKGWRDNLVIGNPDVTWNWESMAEYLAELQAQKVESNVVPFIGHGALRYALVSNENRPLSAAELSAMRNLITESFSAGAFGLSFGFIYVPAIFATAQEISLVMQTVAQQQKILAVHLRSESDELIEAITEMAELADKYSCKLHISHLKAIGKSNWHKLEQALRLIEKYQLTFDYYPYSFGSTTLMSLLPPFVFAECTTNNLFAKLRELPLRNKIKRIFAGSEKIPPGTFWDNVPKLVGWENIYIVEASNKKLVGKSILDIARQRNLDPNDVCLDLLIEERGRITMLDYYADESSIIKKLQHHFGVIGTDTLFGDSMHPRAFGTYSKVISEYVFKNNIISLEEAIAKMASRPATILGLQDRGLMKVGYKADLVIFSEDFCENCNAVTNVAAYSYGLRYVFINGKAKVVEGEYQSKVISGEVVKSR
jgi:N-acyl-D-aspartate/D-glutamate deacylase